ncbi:MAG TPA: hypothetical protein VFV57_05855 [Limnobacter sp.]|nr:hypothetical protein [Limnobacter sp.]
MTKFPLQKSDRATLQLKKSPIHWQSALPFVENTRGLLIHRPRSVMTMTHFGYAYLAVHHYCGNAVCGGKNLTFLSEPPRQAVLCEACETNAVLAGLPAASDIVGRHVHTGRLKVFKNCGCRDE